MVDTNSMEIMTKCTFLQFLSLVGIVLRARNSEII